jgi:regulatory protein
MGARTRRDPAAEPIDDAGAAREAALRLLERTRRTRSDLARRLRDKGFTPAAIEEALARLARVGLVDDVEYARAFLAGRWGRRPAGWVRLQQQLRASGVSDADVREARARIEEREGAIDELATARKVVAQLSRRYAALDRRTREQRLYALLARRGFDGDTIRRALALADDGSDSE